MVSEKKNVGKVVAQPHRVGSASARVHAPCNKSTYQHTWL